jgi:hypothetical protein
MTDWSRFVFKLVLVLGGSYGLSVRLARPLSLA